jgi:hypothetical protein
MKYRLGMDYSPILRRDFGHLPEDLIRGLSEQPVQVISEAVIPERRPLLRRPESTVLVDGNGTQHYRPVTGGGWRPRTHFSGIEVRDTTIGGLPARPGIIGSPVPARNGPFGPSALGPGGQSLFQRRPARPSPFAR